MKTLHFYIVRQVLAALVLSVAVFAFVLLLANVLREAFGLLIGGQASLGMVMEAMGLLIPYVLVYSLPMGLLTATLLIFGRLSADQELTAVRASGISLISLITPVLLFSVLMSLLCAWINLIIAPQCTAAYNQLLYRVGLERTTSFIVENRFMDEFPGYLLYVGAKNGDRLEEVLIFKVEEGRLIERYHAEEAIILSDVNRGEIILQLFRAHRSDLVELDDYYAEEVPLKIQLPDLKSPRKKVRIKDMTFFELREHLEGLEKLVANTPAPRWGTAEELAIQRAVMARAKKDLTSPVRVQMHRQVAFSFACIGFTLVGIPLGIRSHRRETSAGVAMALVLVILYYSFVILGQALDEKPEFAPQLIFWLPNFLFQGMGAFLLWRFDHRV